MLTASTHAGSRPIPTERIDHPGVDRNMVIRALSLRDFRAHVDSRFVFGPGLNLLHGPNGAGKTNVLEALHYCCLGKSFVTSNDQYALRRGAPFFETEAELTSDRGQEAVVRLTFVPGEGKRLAVNGAPFDKLSDAVGRFPVVAISPDDHRLTDGPPDERRRFVDTILCQESRAYMDHLVRYRRALRQRNELLARSRGHGRESMTAVLKAWDEELVRHGAKLTVRRRDFFRRFAPYVAEAWRLIERHAEEPTIQYRAFAPDIDGEETAVAAAMHALLDERAASDRERAVTHTGPHRDELVFRLDGLEVRRYASHGQHRTFVLALKIAQFFYLRDRLDETPLFLLDDVFDNLDPDRIAIFARLLTDQGRQSLVTAARGDLFGSGVDFDTPANLSIRIGSAPVRVPS